MTIGLALILFLLLIMTICFGVGICKHDSDWVSASVIGIVCVCAVFVIRHENIQEDKMQELCIKEGHKVEKVFGTKVCKL